MYTKICKNYTLFKPNILPRIQKDIYNEKPIMKIIRSNRRTLALIVEKNGELTVRAPYHVSDDWIQSFILEKEAWIRSKQEQAQKIQPLVHQFVEGEKFLFLGNEYPLKFAGSSKDLLIFEDAFIVTRSKQANARQILIRWYQNQAREYFSARLDHFSQKHGYHYEKLRLSSAQTRWGSCSRKKVISLTWRLIMAPREVVDYVILHELAHLEFANHSKTFWKKVAQLDPMYRNHRKWLKDFGHRLIL